MLLHGSNHTATDLCSLPWFLVAVWLRIPGPGLHPQAKENGNQLSLRMSPGLFNAFPTVSNPQFSLQINIEIREKTGSGKGDDVLTAA